MRKVLVVEDEASIRELIALNLQMAGWEVLEAENGERGLRRLKEEGPCDAAVLDVMLPGIDGFSLCESIRRDDQNIGIIILSAKGLEEDKIRGLSIGADDYMTKPFEAEELLARLRALTRRRGDVLLDEVSFADVSLDLSTHDLSCGERKVHLSVKEFEVMSILMSSSARVVSKQDLLTRVWGADAEASENSVEAYVSFLRKKLQHVGSKVQITTLRMLGYRLEVFGN